MKAILIAAALALAACTTVPVAGPQAVAESTVLDERAALSVELGYKATRQLAELAVDTGILKPGSSAAQRVADLDNRAYAAVKAVRAAYSAGNASTYAAAVDAALRAVDLYRAAVKG